MDKPLTEMTLEELWAVFPIFLEEHNEDWKEWYRGEGNRIFKFLPGEERTEISHIGSTAIDEIWAKPMVDILLQISKGASMEQMKEILIKNGYLCMSEEENRKSFNRGYTQDGFAERVFHLHLRHRGDNDELYFRDYMNDHPDLAKEYEKLKLSLWEKYKHNQDGYTKAKEDFVIKHTGDAKRGCGKKYGRF